MKQLHRITAVVNTEPCRQVEFGRACLERFYEGATPTVKYYGLLQQSQKSVAETMEAQLYQHWDGLPTSPPKTRPRVAVEVKVEGLQVLSFNNGQPGWPPHIMDKFGEQTQERKEMQKMKDAFEKEFPQHQRVNNQEPLLQPVSLPRAAGRPDFSFDSAEPLDWNRPVDLAPAAVPEPTERRVRALFFKSVLP